MHAQCRQLRLARTAKAVQRAVMGHTRVLLLWVCWLLLQDFMQQLLVQIVEQFPHQALWSMAVVVKSTIRARQVSGNGVA